MASPVVSLTCTFGKAVDSQPSTVDRRINSTRVRRNKSIIFIVQFGP